MKRCDKMSAEPGDHSGPFEFVMEEKEFTVERCQGCGNVVLRRKPTEEKPEAGKVEGRGGNRREEG